MNTNSNLNKAKKEKNDEFYTQYSDIEKELQHYTQHFKDKIVICPCNDIDKNFEKYFIDNFNKLQLKKLITVEYVPDNIHRNAWIHTKEHYACETKQLYCNGSFNSPEVIELIKEADIVVTNPPFSLFREFVTILMEYNKKYLIIGNMNAITYKEIFPLIKENKMWLGCSLNATKCHFLVSNDYENSNVFTESGLKKAKVNNAIWFTNIDHAKRHEPLDLYKRYTPEEYPKYDNYDAINVDKVCDIPMDYDGVIGVPITFLIKYCPEQFEITGLMSGVKHDVFINGDDGRAKFYINGKGVYARVLIKHTIVGLLNHGSDHQYDYAKPILNGKEKYVRLLVKQELISA